MKLNITLLMIGSLLNLDQDRPNPKAVVLHDQAVQLLTDNDKVNDTKAFDLINKAITLDPSYPEAYAVREGIYVTNKQYDRAIDDLEKMMSLLPDRPEPVLEKGEILEKLGNVTDANVYYAEAVQKYQSLLLPMTKKDEDYNNLQLGYAVALIVSNRQAEANKIINALLVQQPSLEAAKRLKNTTREQIFMSMFGQ